MATSKSKSTRNLQLVTKGPKLSRKGRKTAEWLNERYTGPVTLTRKQFDEIYAVVIFAADQHQNTIEGYTPADGEYDKEHIHIVEESERELVKLNRLLFQLETHMRYEDRSTKMVGGAA